MLRSKDATLLYYTRGVIATIKGGNSVIIMATADACPFFYKFTGEAITTNNCIHYALQ